MPTMKSQNTKQASAQPAAAAPVVAKPAAAAPVVATPAVAAPAVVPAAKSAKGKAKATAEVVAAPVVAAPVVAAPVVAAPVVAAPVVAAPVVKASKGKGKTAVEPAEVAVAVPVQEGGAKVPKVKEAKEAKEAKGGKGAKVPKVKEAKEGGKGTKAPKVKEAKGTKVKAPKESKVKAPKAPKVKATTDADEASEDLDGGKRSFKAMLPGSEKYEGRYTGLTPYQAANKALSKYYREEKDSTVVKSSSEITFSIRESTRGSKRSVYTYNGRREKLATPVEYTIKGKDGDRTVVKEYKNRLTKVKKAEAEAVVATSSA